MLTYIIADDDELYRDFTLDQLNSIPNLQCLAVCESAIATRAELQTKQPDFLILDIEMPNLSGVALIKSLKEIPLVIFITSHPDFAVDAFELDAVDYLIKPVSIERLLRAIDKVKLLANLKKNTNPNEAIQTKDADSFFIKDKNIYHKIQYNEVIYAQSLGDFTYIFLENGERKIALANLKSLEMQLPEEKFLRISRTNLINLKKITGMDSESVFLGKVQLSIGKTYSEIVSNTVLGKQVIKRFL
jgi:two-component system LytT family response regulator